MSKVSRRVFARGAFAAATAAAVLPSALAQAPPQPAPPPNPEVDARIQWILTKYGSRLDETQRADIRRIIAGGQKDVETMRAFPLPNGVEPATMFHVYRRRS